MRIYTHLCMHAQAWMDRERTVRFRFLGGPGEAMVFVEVLMLTRAFVGMPHLWGWGMSLLRLLSDTAEWVAHHTGYKQFSMPPEEYTEEQLVVWGPKVLYYLILLWFVGRVILCKKEIAFVDPITHKPTGDQIVTTGTKLGLLLCLGYRSVCVRDQDRMCGGLWMMSRGASILLINGWCLHRPTSVTVSHFQHLPFSLC